MALVAVEAGMPGQNRRLVSLSRGRHRSRDHFGFDISLLEVVGVFFHRHVAWEQECSELFEKMLA
jgi:hypothetical protein